MWISYKRHMVWIFLECIHAIRMWLCEFFMQYCCISLIGTYVTEIDNVRIISNLHVTWEHYQIGNLMHMGNVDICVAIKWRLILLNISQQYCINSNSFTTKKFFAMRNSLSMVIMMNQWFGKSIDWIFFHTDIMSNGIYLRICDYKF